MTKSRLDKMARFLFIVTTIFFGYFLNGQEQEAPNYKLLRSNLGTAGSSYSVETASGSYLISQSIGQGSVIGTHSKNGIYLRQGYQQPMHSIKTIENDNRALNGRIFPNPFDQGVTIAFSSPIESEISILVFDTNGRIVHEKNFSATQKLKINMSQLASGAYFLKAMSSDKALNTKLIKL
ncbi:MAG: T9SS type A sorting domain-containing protein [Bacteroidota bacterium]